jgi:hypothetical protein
VTEQTTNDNYDAREELPLREPDAHGQAAMLLAESLLHGLIARSVITVGDAIEIVEVASEVKEEIADDLGDSPATMRKSLALLGSIRLSLKNDDPGNLRSS